MSRVLSERVEVDATRDAIHVFNLTCDMCGGSDELWTLKWQDAEEMRRGNIPSPFTCRKCRGKTNRPLSPRPDRRGCAI